MDAENVWVPIIAIIFTFGTTFGLLFYYLHTRHRQRLAMLEKGVDPKAFYPKPSTNRYAALKWGLLLIGIGLGFFLGGIIVEISHLGDQIIFASVILFGGLGLVSYFLIVKNNDQDGV